MSRRTIAAWLLLLVLRLDALAQPTTTALVRKWWVEGGLLIGVPRGELDQEKTSMGFGLVAGRTIVPNVSLFGGVRYLKISTDRAYSFFEYTLRHYDLLAGVRYARCIGSHLALFGEAHLAVARFTIGHPDFAGGTGDPSDATGAGAGLRAGAIVSIWQLGIGAAMGYSRAAIDLRSSNLGTRFGDGEPSMADAWLTFDVFAQVSF